MHRNLVVRLGPLHKFLLARDLFWVKIYASDIHAVSLWAYILRQPWLEHHSIPNFFSYFAFSRLLFYCFNDMHFLWIKLF